MNKKYITIDEVKNGWILSIFIKVSGQREKTVHTSIKEVEERVAFCLCKSFAIEQDKETCSNSQ